MSSNSRNIAKAAGILMAAILLSRVLGFVRETVMGMQFGSNWITDAYIAAFTIPDLVYYLLIGGALSAAFIPVFTEYIVRGEKEEAWNMVSIIINIILVVLGTIIVLGIIFAPALVPLVALNFQGKTLDLTIFLTRLMFPAVIFHALNGLAMGILNSFDHFTAPAFGSVVYNLVIILAALLFGQKMGIAGMSLGVVLGAATSFVMQYSVLKKKGIKYRWIIDLKHPGVRKIGALMLPAMIGLSIIQINLVINQNFASFLSAGSITALRFANRLMQLPYGIFASAIAMAIFPTLTKQAAQNSFADLRKTLSLGIRVTNFLSIPAGVGLMAISVPVVRLLFQQGKFGAEATAATAFALFFYALGIFAQCGIAVVTRGYYALQDTVTPLKIGLLTVVLNIIFNFAFIKPLGHGGLALAFSLSGIVNLLVLVVLLRRKMGRIDGKNITVSFVKITASSLVMGGIAYQVAVISGTMVNLHSKLGQLTQVGLAMGIGGGVFLLLAYLLKMEEMNLVVGLLKKKLARGS